ncbi:hypothetical protein GE061_012522 [Apolygus lucorum]|uniref:Reverse transcriptase domain-containing protein n=1 Tax=Apolygus lucorum TaxID=248454 RepID=A0A8S9XTR5_APOLU|nr:hypothetical protein GE061_012522 [Apolygus lucorum]
MDDAIKECKGHTKKFTVGNWRMRQVNISELAFADDVALVARTPASLQWNLDIWNHEMTKRNMVISISKTKTMVISRRPKKHSVTLRGESLEQVECFKYLGAMISQDGTQDQEINTRIAATSRLYHAMGRGCIGKREVSKRTKVAVYKSVYVPTLIHSSESWTTTSRHTSRIQASEMRYLRRVEGKSRRDRVRNQTIRSNLHVDPLNRRVEEAQLRWFGHVVRMPDHRQPRMAWEARFPGRRSIGRPRRRWEENVQDSLQARGVQWGRARALAEDRKGWSALCKNLDTAR